MIALPCASASAFCTKLGATSNAAMPFWRPDHVQRSWLLEVGGVDAEVKAIMSAPWFASRPITLRKLSSMSAARIRRHRNQAERYEPRPIVRCTWAIVTPLLLTIMWIVRNQSLRGIFVFSKLSRPGPRTGSPSDCKRGWQTFGLSQRGQRPHRANDRLPDTLYKRRRLGTSPQAPEQSFAEGRASLFSCSGSCWFDLF